MGAIGMSGAGAGREAAAVPFLKGPREGYGLLMAGRKVSESLVVCDVAEDLLEKLRKFHFHKETIDAAIIMKIEKDKHLVVLDEELEGISPDELKDELPERQPRFIVYSSKYQHDDEECRILRALFSPVLLDVSLSSR